MFDEAQQEIFERISRHCPDAMSAYIQCINRMDEDGSVFFSKASVEIDMSENYHRFRNMIKKLARENILEWHPIDNGIAVNMASHND